MRRTQCARFRHGRYPQRWATLLHVAGGDLNVLELVALATIAKAFAGEAALQDFNTLIHERHSSGYWQTKAAEFMRRVAHANTQINAST